MNKSSLWVSLAQTVFYGAIAAGLPVVIQMITNGGIVIPYGATTFVLWFLNQLENAIQTKSGKPLFGMVG